MPFYHAPSPCSCISHSLPLLPLEDSLTSVIAHFPSVRELWNGVAYITCSASPRCNRPLDLSCGCRRPQRTRRRPTAGSSTLFSSSRRRLSAASKRHKPPHPLTAQPACMLQWWPSCRQTAALHGGEELLVLQAADCSSVALHSMQTAQRLHGRCAVGGGGQLIPCAVGCRALKARWCVPLPSACQWVLLLGASRARRRWVKRCSSAW